MQENRTGYPSQPMPYQGTPQFIQSTYPGFNGAPKPTQYNRKAAIGIGSTQMIIGVVCLVMNSVLIGLNIEFESAVSFIGYGIWGGALVGLFCLFLNFINKIGNFIWYKLKRLWVYVLHTFNVSIVGRTFDYYLNNN